MLSKNITVFFVYALQKTNILVYSSGVSRVRQAWHVPWASLTGAQKLLGKN